MLAKITAKNQLTLPKSLTQAVGATEYFDVEARAGQLILTPVRIQRGDAVRAKLAELQLTADDLADAVAWARSYPQGQGMSSALAAEPTDPYGSKPKTSEPARKTKKTATSSVTKAVIKATSRKSKLKA